MSSLSQFSANSLTSTIAMPHSLVAIESATPTLRVMRLQSPELHHSQSNWPLCENALHTSLCLPDSLTVYVGEMFTAYLGILNSSNNIPIRRLVVTAQLQSPSQRFQLPSRLDPGNSTGGVDVPPNSNVDTIVSRIIEEPGQHILRVEVSYRDAEAGTKTFRKFYRFHVSAPIRITDTTVRVGDSHCLVSVLVEYVTKNEPNKEDALIVRFSGFEASTGLTGAVLGPTTMSTPIVNDSSSTNTPTAVKLLDSLCSMVPGGSCSYVLSVKATSKEATLRGIAAGDYLGRAVFTWSKAMGENGTVSSNSIFCPRAEPIFDQPSTNDIGQRTTCSNFIVHHSGLSVDVAASAGAISSSQPNPNNSNNNTALLVQQFPVTVEAINPPVQMKLNIPTKLQLLVVNHSNNSLTIQLQFNLSNMDHGLVICGHAYKNLGEVKANGGSIVTAVQLLPLQAGLMKVDGCSIVDLASGREILQPPLLSVFVEGE